MPSHILSHLSVHKAWIYLTKTSVINELYTNNFLKTIKQGQEKKLHIKYNKPNQN